MLNKSFFKSGLIIGAFSITAFTTPSHLLLAKTKNDAAKIGADKIPVKLSPTSKALNEASVNVCDANLPTIVSITVKMKENKMTRSNMNDFRDFFRFFGEDPFGDNQDTPKRSEKKKNNDEEKDKEDDVNDQAPQASGSGVILTRDGYIVTNNHVVENAKDNGISVTLHDKKEYKAKLIGRDPLTDLALLKIEADNLSPAFIGNSDSIKVGEYVWAIGNPMGLNYTVTQGIVSAKSRGNLALMSAKDKYAVENFIQTDAAINPGNSGGGLYDMEGKLIGINSAIATNTGTFNGYGFAIPANLMKAVILDLMDDGKINRGYIGVQIKSVDKTDAKALGLNEVAGVIVNDVQKGKPGDKAGLQEGDVIIEIDGKKVESNNELQSVIAEHQAGDKIKLGIIRDGKKIYKDVKLESREDDADSDSPSEKIAKKGGESDDDADKALTFDNFGFTVDKITESVKKSLDTDDGALITGVKNRAGMRGLTQGGVIIKADGQKINSPKDLKKIVDGKKSGDALLLVVKYKDSNRVIALEAP